MRFWKTLLLGALMNATLARAVVVSVEATGNWEYYNGPDFDYHLVPYTVRFTYDTTAAPTSQTAQQAVYPAMSLSLTVYLDEGTWSHTTTSPHITLNNGTFSDSFLIGSQNNPAGAPSFLGAAVDFFGFDLTAPNTRFASTSLPATLDFGDFYFRKAKIYTGGFANNYISQDSLTLGPPAAVPEPATWTLMAGALAFGAVVMRRKFARAA